MNIMQVLNELDKAKNTGASVYFENPRGQTLQVWYAESAERGRWAGTVRCSRLCLMSHVREGETEVFAKFLVRFMALPAWLDCEAPTLVEHLDLF